MPPVRSIVTENQVIKYSHESYYAGGNQDWFGIGTADAMLPYLERFLALPTLGGDIHGILQPSARGLRSWRAESFLVWYLQDVYNISLAPDKRIVAGLIELTGSSQSVA